MKCSRQLGLVFLVVFTIMGSQWKPSLAQAATYTVTTTQDVVDPQDGVLSLREAVSMVSSAPDADTILIPSGTYLLTKGPLAVSSTLILDGSGRDNTVLDGGGTQRILSLYAGKISIRDLAFRNGYTRGPGGAILASADVESLEIANSRFDHNQAAMQDLAQDYAAGGAIYSETGHNNFALQITGTDFNKNTAFFGGAILLDAQEHANVTLAIDQSTFSGNRADDGSEAGWGLYGGAISAINVSEATITSSTFSQNCVVSDNNISFGGALYISGMLATDILLKNDTFNENCAQGEDSYGAGGAVSLSAYAITIDHTLFKNNSATSVGGAVNIDPHANLQLSSLTMYGNEAGYMGGALYVQDPRSATITKSSFIKNTVNGGGGAVAMLYNNSSSTVSTTILENLTLANNTASGCGGGLYTDNPWTENSKDSISLKNVTIAENTAASGGGICRSTYSTDTLNLKNSILVGNSAPIGADCSGTIYSEGYNIVQSSNNCGITFLDTDINGVASVSSILMLPLSGDATSAPGYPHYNLPESSLARDAGSEDTDCLRPDQLGKGAYGRCDIGSVEYDTDTYDADGDGYTEHQGDCNDGDPQSYCHASETSADGIDNNCNGLVDEPPSHLVNGTSDDDLDQDGYSESKGDCDDYNSSINPAATEYLDDGVDNDCDCLFDEADDNAVPTCVSSETGQTAAITAFVAKVSLSTSERTAIVALLERQTQALLSTVRNNPHLMASSGSLLAQWQQTTASRSTQSISPLLRRTGEWLTMVNAVTPDAERSRLAAFVQAEAKAGVTLATFAKDLARFLTKDTQRQGLRLFGRVIF